MCKRFRIVRDHHDGVNGPGIVAEGVVFSSGRVALSWLTEPKSTQVFDTMSGVVAVQGKNAITRILWVDTDTSSTPRAATSGLEGLRKARENMQAFIGGVQVTEDEDAGCLMVRSSRD